MLLTALAIKLDSRGPVLISQQRVGKDGVPFAFYKFRSMRTDAEAARQALPAQQSGRRCQASSRTARILAARAWAASSGQLTIDELPQLFNVLRGDMSLVGPRPPLPSRGGDVRAAPHEAAEVIGGITGMWQVSGRSNIESSRRLS